MGVIDESYAHRLRNVGNRYYQYDSNGNIICEQEGSFDENSDPYIPVVKTEGEDVYSSDYGWGLFKESSKGSPTGEAGYRRVYTWNERNQLISSVDSLYNTAYVYGQDGQRSNKYTDFSETLYFNSMWTHHTDTGNSIYGGQTAKNIYLGETRIVTKLNSGKDPTSQEEYYKQYYYHSDHLGSAQLITDYKGDEYQRIEYTPYGETWVEKTSNTGSEFLPYKFTGKELDPETGLYYYGARYLDPKYSIWISADPALGEYIPGAPVNEEAKKRNGNLPGMGGVFNTVNLHLYHYAGNNPVKYVDPDGRYIELFISKRSGTMEVMFTLSGSTTKYAIADTTAVVTNVVKNTPDNSKSSDTSRTQSNGSNPTQVANGRYRISVARAPSIGDGKYGTGDQGLYLSVTQILPVANSETGETVADTGYMVHITPYSYTDGCVGIPYDANNSESKAKAEEIMNKLVEIFTDTMSKDGDKEAYVTFWD